ncbi:retrovirus-related pol polyprotein from transposon TNT 1-94 [Tanacetum coccineum]
MIGDSVISKVYYVEGLGHNLYYVGQFCDSDLEVAFRKHSCYVRDTDGVELIKGSRGSNLYTISVEDMMKSSPICSLSKTSKNKSWLWHRRLNHLNFGTINDLARKDLVRGLPRLKFKKDHLCSACQLGKSKKHTHTPKAENTDLEVFNTLHMDLRGPMQKLLLLPVTPKTDPSFTLIITKPHMSWCMIRSLILPFSKSLVFFVTLPMTARILENYNQQLILEFSLISSGLVPNPFPTIPYVPLTNKELDILFQPMFNEYLEPQHVERPVSPAPAVPVLVNSADTPSSTTVDQDAPSPSHSL